MDLLIDTHALIWFLNGDRTLSKKAQAAIENPDNLCLVSLASFWEIALKMSLKKLSFEKGLTGFIELTLENGMEVLPISLKDTIVLAELEFIHRDPFDRLLIAQTLNDNLTIVTADENIKMYKVNTLW